MKHHVLLFCLIGIALLQGCGDGEMVKYSYRKYGLNQPVKSFKTTVYEAESKFGEVVKGRCEGGVHVFDFNEKGFISGSTSYDCDGNPFSIFKFTYDEAGRCSRKSRYDGEGTEVSRNGYEYDGDHLIKETIWDDWGDVYEYEYEYKRGNLVESRLRGSDGGISVYKYSKHDKTGWEWTAYDENGDEFSRGEGLLDKKGLVVKSTVEDETFEVKRNDLGLPLTTRMVSWSYGAIDGFREAEYETYNYQYEYDEKGNWIKVTEFRDETKVPNCVVEREITY